MYLFIFEDGSVNKSAEFSDEDKQACDDGYLQVLDLHEENPMYWWNGQWEPVDLL